MWCRVVRQVIPDILKDHGAHVTSTWHGITSHKTQILSHTTVNTTNPTNRALLSKWMNENAWQIRGRIASQWVNDNKTIDTFMKFFFMCCWLCILVIFDFVFQPNARLVYYIFSYSSTCFEPYCAHHQEGLLYIHSIWFFIRHSS